MNIEELVSIALVVIAVSGCSDPEKMDRAPLVRDVVVPGSYQSVFARTLSMARSCWGSGGSFDLDGQLYPDLKYAELSQTASWVGEQIRVRFEPSGTDTRIQVQMASIGGKELLARTLEAWARGAQTCRV